MKKKPDFMGNFMLLEDEEQQRIREKYAGITKEMYIERVRLGCGFFSMFIEEREKKGDLEIISGRITDNYGEAIFTGELGKDFIKFVKRYYEGDSGMDCEIPYEAKLDNLSKIFLGKYFMREEKESWHGIFILQSTESILKEAFGTQLN
jgi:hypothetical protein